MSEEKKIKIKNLDLVNGTIKWLFDAFDELKVTDPDGKLPFKTQYWLDRTYEKVVKLTEQYLKTETELLDKYTKNKEAREDFKKAKDDPKFAKKKGLAIGPDYKMPERDYGEDAELIAKELKELQELEIEIEGINKIEIPLKWKDGVPIHHRHQKAINLIFDSEGMIERLAKLEQEG